MVGTMRWRRSAARAGPPTMFLRYEPSAEGTTERPIELGYIERMSKDEWRAVLADGTEVGRRNSSLRARTLLRMEADKAGWER